jgi:tetratricopeptide (TPR) repeat protein
MSRQTAIVATIVLLTGLAACVADSPVADSGYDTGYPTSSSAASSSAALPGPPGDAYKIAGPAYAPGGSDSRARSDLASGNVEGAEAGFEQAVDVNPFDPIALNNLAVAKTEAGQFHEALALLQRAERLAPQNNEIAANLARLRAWNQNYAMQDGSTLGQPLMGTGNFKNLPPEPPALWDTRTTR